MHSQIVLKRSRTRDSELFSVPMQISLDALRVGVLWTEHAPHDSERVLEHLKRVALFVGGGASV